MYYNGDFKSSIRSQRKNKVERSTFQVECSSLNEEFLVDKENYAT